MCFLSVDNSHVTSLGLKVLWSNENAIRFGTWNADVSVTSYCGLLVCDTTVIPYVVAIQCYPEDGRDRFLWSIQDGLEGLRLIDY
jgi:hypothetical protein